jgi:acyl carrier protein
LWELRDRLGKRGVNDLFDLDARLSDLGIESLDLVELVMEIEEAYDLNVSEDEAAQIQTVDDVLRLIRRRKKSSDDT